MTEVRLAKSAGFCFGVSRSVNMARVLLRDGACLSLGSLIHNGSVVSSLKEQGLEVIDSPSEAKAGERVIIRAHGVSAADMEELKARGAIVTDATCPNVARIHRIVEKADKNGRLVIVLGAAGHPEVEGIRGRCHGALVVSGVTELEKWLSEEPERREKPITFVAQTTQTEKNFGECDLFIKKLCTNAEIFDTICSATFSRQQEAIRLASECEAMVVIGGRNSANSVNLARLCAERCANTQFIENAEELDFALLNKANPIGVTAGASAPEWIIKEVLDKMSEEILKNEIPEEAPAAEPEAEAVVQPEAVEEAKEVNETAAKGEKSFDEMLEDSLKTIYNGDRVSGVVVAISPTEVSIDLGTKYSAFIPTAELTEDGAKKLEEVVSIGDTVEAIVVRVNDVEGTAQLSKKRLDTIKNWSDIEAAAESGAAVEGTVTEENKGGVVVNVRGVRVFVPASQSGLPKDTPMTELVGQKVRLKITETNRGRKRVVGSIRAVAQRERRERIDALWSGMEVGKVYQGTVKSLTSYGAFVDIGGVDGMVHVSELSWKHINTPAEVVKVGDPIEVFVIAFDREARRISLGHRKPEDNPWTKFIETCDVGDVVKVTIVKLMPFGAFAEVLPGVDGLIHISQLANRRVAKADEAVSVGDIVDAKITAIDKEKQKISLSIRALNENDSPRRRAPEPEPEEEPEQAQGDALVFEVSETGELKGNLPEDAE